MLKTLKILILLIIFSISSHLFASAAEKWQYDVTPDTSQKLNITGHKVDAYGNAANDYQYKTKIDPKTATARTASGTVGMGRLLKTTGWGILGVAALEALLKSVDWVIDPEAQNIWRNKPNNSATPDCGLGHIFRYQTSQFRQCPIDAVNEQLAKWQTSTVRYEFKSWDVNIFDSIRNKQPIKFTVTQISSSSSTHMPNQNLEYKVDPNAAPREKEYLTPETLADYTTHSHPDFADPTLAPKLEPHYTPQLAPDLFKPANPWEKENSPAVKEVEKELEKAKPEPKDDKIKENEPDPETGGKSFSLPAFCSWATSVCEFIDWVKKDDLPEKDDSDLEITTPLEEKKVSVNVSAQCPAPTYQTVNFHGISAQIKTTDYSFICDLSWLIKPFVIGFATISAAFIIFGFQRGSED